MNHQATTEEVIEPEIVEETAVAKRSPVIPVTLAELAALKGEAIEIVEARIQVLETLRKASIRATSPEDWLLFKSDDGNVTAYLQDCGADRVRDLYGIEIYDVSLPQKVAGVDGGFTYIITGSGRCKLTRQILENVEGGRSSTDDFCKKEVGVKLELAVRKAARANLDGTITRELAGLKNVPLRELEAAWTGTNKRSQNCRLGRGFGSGAERAGAQVQHSEEVPAGQEPICEICGRRMNFIKAGTTKAGKPYAAFWSCPDGGEGRKHARSTIAHSDYLKTIGNGSQTERQPGEEG